MARMTLAYLLIALMITIGLAPMVWEVRQKKFDFFNLKNPFIIYFVIQLGISGLITLSIGQASEIGLDPVLFYDRYLQALLLSCISLLLFQIGYYTRRRRALVLPQIIRRPWGRNRHVTVFLVCSLAGFSAFALLLAANGGISEFLANREAFRAGGMIGQGVFIFPATSMITTAALVYFLGTVRAKPKRSVALAIIMLALAITPAYFMGFRSAIALPVLQFMVAWRYGYRSISSGKLAALLIVIAAGFTLYGFSREIPEGVSVNAVVATEILVENPELIYTVFSRSKGTEVVASVINTLSQTGEFEFGWRSIIEAATILIPRAIFEDKPMASSQRFTTYFFGETLALARGVDLETWGGISPTVVGELYWHFGFIGVFVGLFFMGRLASVAYFTLLKNLSNPSVIVIYSICFTTFVMFAEAIQGYFNAFVMYVPLLLIIFSYLGVRLRYTQRFAPASVVGSPVK